MNQTLLISNLIPLVLGVAGLCCTLLAKPKPKHHRQLIIVYSIGIIICALSVIRSLGR